MHNTSKVEADVQWNKTTGWNSWQKSLKLKAAVCTGWPKLGNRRLEKLVKKTNTSWPGESWFLQRHLDGRIRIWHNHHETWICQGLKRERPKKQAQTTVCRFARLREWLNTLKREIEAGSFWSFMNLNPGVQWENRHTVSNFPEEEVSSYS